MGGEDVNFANHVHVYCYTRPVNMIGYLDHVHVGKSVISKYLYIPQ